MHRLVTLPFAICLAAASLASLPAAAQGYPNRPVRLVVPFAPGGPADIAARAFGGKMGEVLEQTVVIDNRPGGGAVLGTEIVAKSRPDGYTILLCSTSVLVINPLVNPKLPYDPQRDVTPISLITISPYVLIVHPSVPARSVKELIALAKAKPGSLNYGSAGFRSTSHLVGEIFRGSAGIDIVHVAYKGSGPAAADLIAGHLQLAFESVSSALPNVKAGRLRALGISTRERFPLTPDIPTISESGVPGFEAATWQGVCAPGGVDKAVVTTLHRAIAQSARAPEVSERLAALGAQSVGSTPEEFIAFVKAELPRWGKAIRESGATPR